jgi:hypothetical protein
LVWRKVDDEVATGLRQNSAFIATATDYTLSCTGALAPVDSQTNSLAALSGAEFSSKKQEKRRQSMYMNAIKTAFIRV